MTASYGLTDRTTLNSLSPNLDIGDVADPALRLAYFQYLADYGDATYTGIQSQFATKIAAGALSELGVINVKSAPYNASGLATTAVGSITTGTKVLTLTTTPDFANGQGINLQGAMEASSLQVTAAATVSSNVTVTLNGVAFPVAVVNGDTAIQVATKIRAATYAGWTAGGTAGTDTVTFTSTTSGTKTDATYSAGTTTATGTMTTTTQGTADQISTVSSVSGLVVNIADNSTRTISAGTILHDDTAALQAALTVLVAGSGELDFPTGTYNVSSAISATILVGKKIKIKGIGRVEIISTVVEPGAEAGIFNFTGTTTSSIEIENIILTHNGVASGLLNGVYCKTFLNATLKDVTVTKATLWGGKLESVLGGMVENCHFNDNRYAGFALCACENIDVIGGTYSSNGTTAPTDGYGISCMATVLGLTKNILITGIQANGNKRKGIDIHHGHNITITGNFVVGFEYAGIYAVNEDTSKDVRDIVIEGNTVDGTGASGLNSIYAIWCGAAGSTSTESGTFIVENNTIRNIAATTTDHGIFVSNATTGGISPDKVIIDGNTVENFNASAQHIIRLDNALVNIKKAIIMNNILHAVTCSIGISAQKCDEITVTNNMIEVGSGTVTYGILTSSAIAIITGNQIFGAATYTTPIYRPSLTTGNVNSNMVSGVIASDDLLRFKATADLGKKIEVGSVNVTILSGTKIGTAILVTFGVAFTAVPIVLATIQNSSASANAENPMSVFIYNPLTSSFTITLYATANVAADRVMTIGWMAIGL